jgi:ADP-ribose pyrophosphatase YjhB (NUDIX family)
MIFRKIRYLSFAYLSLGLAKLFFVRVPPVVSVSAIIRENDKILCIELSYYDGLGLPGGVVEGDEEPAYTLVREVEEETGLRVEHSQFLGTASAPFRGIHCLSLVYAVTVSGTARGSAEGKVVWVTPTDAKQRLVYPNARKAVERFSAPLMS